MLKCPTVIKRTNQSHLCGDVSMFKINRIPGKASIGDGANEPCRGASPAQC